MAEKKLTMQQFAQMIGLSRTTVSLVLQGKGDAYRIARETQDRVKRLAQEYNFQPNYHATALNRGKTGVVGAIFPDVFENFMGLVVRGIESVIYRRGYTMMLSTTRFDNQLEKRLVEQYLYQGVDGFLLVFTAPFRRQQFDYSHLEQIQEQGIPMVLIDRYLPGFSAPMVIGKDYEQAYEGVHGLLTEHITRIVCITLDLEITTIDARIRGYIDAAKQGGIPPEVIRLEQCDPHSDDLWKALSQIVEDVQSQGRLSELAVFSTTSGLADKAAWIFRQLGLVPGRDVTILRFGTTTQWLDAGIRDIPQPQEQMGKEAAHMLLQMIETGTTPEDRVLG
ncbi:LacI family DNA-binding transcriptional regulator [Sphaerochaeta halotolerans]|jgi:DNA-binding LacI/PurR family transcriptional regulator|uniref:LacI family DNA-binding transcriptional regulator n=1 Tax=Sphaerochaeta halotolerans TaxID=2293840 RepID=UPI001370748F|nr:LacI family DNA-binding transcriptional regulator [Sphaerochaeta halotolerans]MXI85246.1 LacI family DNA-binding transcriptional regulator [Sphaerochaeta halotolerans]